VILNQQMKEIIEMEYFSDQLYSSRIGAVTKKLPELGVGTV
jgi:hypothetical protein